MPHEIHLTLTYQSIVVMPKVEVNTTIATTHQHKYSNKYRFLFKGIFFCDLLPLCGHFETHPTTSVSLLNKVGANIALSGNDSFVRSHSTYFAHVYAYHIRDVLL